MKLSTFLIIGSIIAALAGLVKIMMPQSVKIILFALTYGSILKKFPEPSGPYSVGTTSYHLIDHDRKEKSGAPRELIVQFWYPSNISRNKEPLFPYMADKMHEIIRVTKSETNPYIPDFIWNKLFNIKIYAEPNAKISNAKTSYPVLIFSHGMGSYRDEYSVFIEDLASHGYIVVSIDHTGLNGLTVFPDGHIVIPDKSEIMDPNISSDEILQIINKSVQTCVQDIQFVLNRLITLNENQTERFYKKLNLDRIGVLGHSLGGMASVEVCRVAQQIKAGIDLDGWIDFISTKGIAKPFMCLLGEKSFLVEKSNEPSKERAQFFKMTIKEYMEWKHSVQKAINEFCQNNGKFGYQIIIKDAGHMTFSDLILAKNPVVRFLNLEIGTVQPYKAIKVINNYIRTFFDKYLKDVDISSAELCNLYPEDVIVKKCSDLTEKEIKEINE